MLRFIFWSVALLSASSFSIFLKRSSCAGLSLALSDLAAPTIATVSCSCSSTFSAAWALRMARAGSGVGALSNER